MARWEPDAQGRLQQAAVSLFLDRGYDAVTIVEIADRAGLTKRTFFNHFADKRDVLFSGAAELERTVVDAVKATPPAVRPIEVVIAALGAAGTALTTWGEAVRQRQRIVASSTELRERELIKMDSLATAIATALENRDVDRLTATLVAQIAVAAFMTAFQQWADSPKPVSFSSIMNDAVRRIRTEFCDQRTGLP